MCTSGGNPNGDSPTTFGPFKCPKRSTLSLPKQFSSFQYHIPLPNQHKISWLEGAKIAAEVAKNGLDGLKETADKVTPKAPRLSASGVTARGNKELKIEYNAGSCTIKLCDNPEKHCQGGWVHFAIPSPGSITDSKSRMKTLHVDFEAKWGSIRQAKIFWGQELVFKSADDKFYNKSFVLEIPKEGNGKAVYNGKGISVSLWVVVSDHTYSVTIESVGVQL
ncbi:hypothetical protein QBC38DRAFT_453324 [Podospora fimiseda]|uniref:Uncharacterized protein n=1 Tax=Podospora fimiseda TaxID=252190 RepID=A0AAN7BTM8_9PEZI|nr:hypothetical protein QBC38DRAFT_453324 [Podospora fimiseda]